MLSRVASNIYWMGRYLERSEHLARYTKVQYFSMYDAPHLQNINFVLSSIVNMTGIDYDLAKNPLIEQDIILKVGLDQNDPASIMSQIFAARENARSARNVLSDELWEMINQYYLFITKVDPEHFKTRGLYEFTRDVNSHCHKIKSCVRHTLLHEFGWMMISLGIYIERTNQIIRTIKSKLTDIKILSENERNPVLEEYQWTTALQIVEAFDIYRRYIKRIDRNSTPINFMIFHKTFPRSIVYSLGKVNEMINIMCSIEPGHNDLRFHAGRLYNKVKYTAPGDLTDLSSYMDHLLAEVLTLHQMIDHSINYNTGSSRIEITQEQESIQ